MKFKHTPAPWKHTIRNANEIMTTFHGVTIGDVYLDITTANQKADSHLIAAASELLDALQIICFFEDIPEPQREIAEKAIKKALGEEK